MWPPWIKTRSSSSAAVEGGDAAFTPRFPPRSPSFSFSTLKDVQTLILNDAISPAAAPLSSPALRVFHRVRIAASALRALRSLPSPSTPDDRRIVLYFTSLRVVRATFEDCRYVRSILRGFRVAVDERDLAMDPRFLDELKGLLVHRRRHVTLPQVFVGGRYVGGADEIRQLHESGELRRLVEGAPAASAAACGRCYGARFVLCQSCSGSHKRYSEKGGFRSCNSCNENGLLRCPDCFPPAV
ncbi:uncharacterized protein At5g39865-like [Typha latifolia]|uniref:uncharacterized protein At5g39865-like n=1 Tax=Typha latifolia TaxID=4733 RepID=UPI003C2BDBEE